MYLEHFEEFFFQMCTKWKAQLINREPGTRFLLQGIIV